MNTERAGTEMTTNQLKVSNVENIRSIWYRASFGTIPDEIQEYDEAAFNMRKRKAQLDQEFKKESEEFKAFTILQFLNSMSAWIGFNIFELLRDEGISLTMTEEADQFYRISMTQAMDNKRRSQIAAVNVFKIEEADISYIISNMSKIIKIIGVVLNSEMTTNFYFNEGEFKDQYVFYKNLDIESSGAMNDAVPNEEVKAYMAQRKSLSHLKMQSKTETIEFFERVKLIMEAGAYEIQCTKRAALIRYISNIKIRHLDQGYVKIINHMGDDAFAARFARSSYDNTEIINLDKDKRLVHRLVKDRHTSPLEACQLAFEIETSMFVRDQHVRHRMASINIQSNRYAKHQGKYYVPKKSRIKMQSSQNKQGSGEAINEEVAGSIIEDLMNKSLDICYANYEKMLSYGVTRELARGILGSSFYSKISWSIDTHNLMHYLKLRNTEEAQEEIRELAKIIELFFELLFPNMYESYDEYIKNAVSLSKTETELLKVVISEKDLVEIINKFKDSGELTKVKFLESLKAKLKL